MEANEMRLGNYVQTSEDDSYPFGQVTCITEELITVGSDTLEPKYVRPIPLTEDWLLKMRFLRNDALSSAEENYEFPTRMGLFFLSKHTTMINKTVYYGLSFPGSLGSVYKPVQNQCRYVHQLQNLYFALTNTELTINL